MELRSAIVLHFVLEITGGLTGVWCFRGLRRGVASASPISSFGRVGVDGGLFITVAAAAAAAAGAGAGLQHVVGVVTASPSCLERGSDEGNAPVVVLPVPIAASKPPPPAMASSL